MQRPKRFASIGTTPAKFHSMNASGNPKVLSNEALGKPKVLSNEALGKPKVLSNEASEKPKVLSNEASEKPRVLSNEASRKPKTLSNEESRKFAQLAGIDKATEGRCGSCEGCSRRACGLCSACKREEYEECIDVYCTNQKSGLSERAAIRELYLQTLKNQKDEALVQVKVEEEDPDDYSNDNYIDPLDTDEGTIKEKVDKIMAIVTKKHSEQKEAKKLQAVNKMSTIPSDGAAPKRPYKHNVVYGSSRKALKLRRCGECEGCTRDDCGKCAVCIDNPRFGGKGTKRIACLERYCRLKAGKVP